MSSTSALCRRRMMATMMPRPTTTSAAATTTFDTVAAQHAQQTGVNLDEEAAALMKYQQAYQAAAQVMTTARTLFEALLQIR